jgi:Ca2+-transporting ATPase
MIITDDNFATIVAAVEEGRGIYDNIRKTLQYLLAGNSGELLLMTICVAFGFPSPLLSIHLLWINLVTDGLPALCLASDPIDPDVMKRRPRRRSEKITDRGFLPAVALTGVLTAGVAFAVYVSVLRTGTTDTARTSAFTVLVFAELLRSFGARSETTPVWRISLLSNVNLLLVVALSVGLQVFGLHNAAFGRFLHTSSMSLADCAVLFALGAMPLAALEAVKPWRSRQSQATV